MKARLKYPIFSFAPKGNMIYVFRKEELYTTTNTELLKKRKNYIVVWMQPGRNMLKRGRTK